MGSLLSLFRKRRSNAIKANAVLDFENAKPTPEEMEVYEMVKNATENCEEILRTIKEYHGAEVEIKQAMQDPNNEEAIKEVWKRLVPLVDILKKSYDFSEKLKNFLPILLQELCCGDNLLNNFERKQALAKLFASTLYFTMEFDIIKMNNPSIQNDFSFYRRTISRSPLNSDGSSLILNDVQGDDVNSILLLIANPCPLMSRISELTVKHFQGDNKPNLAGVTESFATLASLCRYMAETPSVYQKFQNKDTKIFCMRVMVSLIVVYDNVHPDGVFYKNSSIDIKACIKFLKEQEPSVSSDLLKTLKYTTKHFNDLYTPNSIKAMLSEAV